MTIPALGIRPLWLFSVLSSGAGVALVLAAASPSAMADTSARVEVVAAGAGVASSGQWGPPAEVAAALNTGDGAAVSSVSCASAGNCSGGGYYTDSSGNIQAFVVSEVNGTWGPAKEVAAALNTLGVGQVESVSCGSAGNCAAGGYYSNSSLQAPFVVSEVNGTWGPAKAVAAALNKGGSARILSMSCGSAGNCSAGGYYTDSSGQQAFAVNETNGTWRPAAKVAGATGVGGTAGLYSVSCGSAGNCSGGGFYTPGPGQQAFVANEANGTWGPAAKVAGALNAGKYAWLYSVSCGSAGNCSAGGIYTNNAVPRQQEAFVVNEANGTWQPATEMAGALNTGGVAAVNSVSCVTAGYCGAGGSYTDSSGQQAFVTSKP